VIINYLLYIIRAYYYYTEEMGGENTGK